jgi:hypothetical protein
MSRPVPFQKIYEAIVSRLGLDPTQPVPHNLWQALPRNVNKRLRTAWTYWEWPYLEQCDERAFQRIWNDYEQFRAGEKVIFIRDMLYYQAKSAPESGPPIGALPTDTSYWDPLEDYGSLILFDQICRRPMGMVLGVYQSDPRLNGQGCKCGMYYRPEGNGVAVLGGHGPSVFVKYQLPVPSFTLTPYAPGRAYAPPMTVYDGITGECYLSILASQNVAPPDPAGWLKLDFPDTFEDYVVAGVYADCLKESDQSGVAADQQQMRMMWAKDAAADAEERLVEEIDKLRAMGQRYHYRAWKQAAYAMRAPPGVCISEPFDPTQGQVPAPPVTTLSEICETDATAYPPPPPPVIIQGPPGPTGPTGATGAAGRAGEVWYSGEGPPPDPYPGANPGDWYMDELTGDIYELGT